MKKVPITNLHNGDIFVSLKSDKTRLGVAYDYINGDRGPGYISYVLEDGTGEQGLPDSAWNPEKVHVIGRIELSDRPPLVDLIRWRDKQ